MDFVISQLQLLEEHKGTNFWWTGGIDIGREGAWYWASTLTPVGDFIWQSGMPRNNTDWNCMLLSPSMNYKAQDHYCNNAPCYAICQKE